MKGRITYRSAGVSYELLDAFKRRCQREAAKTTGRIRQLAHSRGESAYVWEEKDCFRAMVIEGLGTKNLVADEMQKITGKTYYGAIAKDTVAAIVNDLIVVGATPEVITAYFAVGRSEWFADTTRARDLANGWARACKEADVAWGGGETPTVKGIVEADTIDLAGSAVGVIKPKQRLTLGDKLKEGDAILLLESSGIHANGLTLARKIARTLPKGYTTKLPDRSMFGEAILRPTHIYAATIEDLFKGGIPIHYMVHITGHGWRKLMRANRAFQYIIENVGKPHMIFDFIQKHARLTDEEMYATFNMGAGFAVYLSKQDVNRAQTIIARHHLRSWVAGYVRTGLKKVSIPSKNITFASNTLNVRGGVYV